jgi:MFS family permease
MISGFAYSLVLSLAGLFAGSAVDKYNRKMILGLACIGWGLSSYLTGSLVTGVLGIAISRFMVGIF